MRDGKYRAILIDDESWTRDVLRYLGDWEGLGIEIIAEASDGDYGLELILNLEPDIIVCDVKMPAMDGLTLLSILRKKDCQAQVLFVSGYDNYQYVRTAMQLRAADYLLKPIKQDELNKQLGRCISELRQVQGMDRTKALNPQIIMNAVWFSEYINLRAKITEALKINRHELMCRQMERLKEMLIQNEGDSLPKDMAIYIYFDFYNILHQFISDNGLRFQDCVNDKSGLYVFGNDFSAAEMFQVLVFIFLRAAEKIEQLHKAKNKINIEQVCAYAEANYNQNITLEQTADKFYVSKEYLSKVFKSETGMGFVSYITALRMKKAKELLLTDSAAIKEVAEIVGYKETGHFYKVFKKYFGLTPGEMLQNMKK